ncbi:MAG: pyrroline-5-carboxylate reductase [Chloroflexota bacterium]
MTSLMGIRTAFIGGGVMAEAILRGLLRQGLAAPGDLVAADPLAERRAWLARELGIGVTAANAEAAQGAQVVVLAVKPQALGQALASLQGQIAADALVFSIVAGATLRAIVTGLGVGAVVRVMPNTPGQIGEGISVWTATPATSELQRQRAQAVLGALGAAIYTQDEGDLDKATALSGSGPAYVFLFIEALADAGVRMGFSRAVAEQLALQTVRGAAIYAQTTGEHLAILRNRVTSPAGTTAEALHAFEEGGLRAVVSRAVMAAYHRAQALGELKQ